MASVGKLKKDLKKIEERVFVKLGLKNVRVEVALISDSQMEKIRGGLVSRPDFKGREATKIRSEKHLNVLSFPEDSSFPRVDGFKNLGEIYINTGLTKGDFDVVVYLFVHGLLHLLGYEHFGKRATIEMEKLEKEVFLAAME